MNITNRERDAKDSKLAFKLKTVNKLPTTWKKYNKGIRTTEK